jgi:hypothetical protein
LISRMVAALWCERHNDIHRDRSQKIAGLPR